MASPIALQVKELINQLRDLTAKVAARSTLSVTVPALRVAYSAAAAILKGGRPSSVTTSDWGKLTVLVEKAKSLLGASSTSQKKVLEASAALARAISTGAGLREAFDLSTPLLQSGRPSSLPLSDWTTFTTRYSRVRSLLAGSTAAGKVRDISEKLSYVDKDTPGAQSLYDQATALVKAGKPASMPQSEWDLFIMRYNLVKSLLPSGFVGIGFNFGVSSQPQWKELVGVTVPQLPGYVPGTAPPLPRESYESGYEESYEEPSFFDKYKWIIGGVTVAVGVGAYLLLQRKKNPMAESPADAIQEHVGNFMAFKQEGDMQSAWLHLSEARLHAKLLPRPQQRAVLAYLRKVGSEAFVVHPRKKGKR